MSRQNLKGLTRDELDAFVLSIGEKPFRTKQIWGWMYEKGATRFDAMTTLSKDLRAKLEKIAAISTLTRISDNASDENTRKFLWQLKDGLEIESVYIPEGKRRTVCISSQVGCRLKCAFCATGTLGCTRNLKADEIIDQVLSIGREVGEKPSNIVVMGMGEPFLNYDNVIKALRIINDPDGIAIGHRKITLSTAGIVPQIYRYADEGHPFKLAVSLNATTNETRSRIMPINKKYPLGELFQAIRYYIQKTRHRITFEYVLLNGVNDTPDDAQRLLRMLKDIPSKINLIGYNRTTDAYRRPSDEQIERFAESIRPLAAPVTLRLSRGSNINAACGQLAGRRR